MLPSFLSFPFLPIADFSKITSEVFGVIAHFLQIALLDILACN